MNITIVTKNTKPGGHTLGRTLLIYLAAKSGRAINVNGPLTQAYYDACKQLDSISDKELVQFFETFKQDGDITVEVEDRNAY